MKFGELLREVSFGNKKLGPHFVQFEALKLFIEKASRDGKQRASNEDTTKFVKLVKAEADRINPFAMQTLIDIRNSFVHFLVQMLECKLFAQSKLKLGGLGIIAENAQGLAIDQQVLLTIQAVEGPWQELSDELVQFAQFCRLNVEAFRKIIKKFDKWASRNVGDVLYAEFGGQPFASLPLHELLIVLGEGCSLLQECRTLHQELIAATAAGKRVAEGLAVEEEKKAWVPPPSFERTTFKFWVRKEDVLGVCIDIAKKLPVLVFGKEGRICDDFTSLDAASVSKMRSAYETAKANQQLTSVYLDDHEHGWPSYHTRIARQEGALLFRMRWYGDNKNKIFFERKTHHETWITDSSAKERFYLPLERVDAFLAGKWMPTARDYEGVHGAKSMLELAEQMSLQLVRDGQCAFKPVIRTAYLRTAFQSATDNDVRISIDTNMWLSDELNLTTSWSKTVKRQFNVKELPADQAFGFPHAILEIKLNDPENPPQWIVDLKAKWAISIVPVFKFSKFLSAVTMFHRDQIKGVPHWFQADGTMDLRLGDAKLVMSEGLVKLISTANLPKQASESDGETEKESKSPNRLIRRTSSDGRGTSIELTANPTFSPRKLTRSYSSDFNTAATEYTSILSAALKSPAPVGGGATEFANHALIAVSTARTMVQPSPMLLKSEAPKESQNGAKLVVPSHLVPSGVVQAISHKSSIAERADTKETPAEVASEPTKCDEMGFGIWGGPNGIYSSILSACGVKTGYPEPDKQQEELKRFFPVRVEPKTFFANERTFLKWLQLIALLFAVAAAFASTQTLAGIGAGIGFAVLSVLIVIYAFSIFVFRARALATKSIVGAYDDRFGPTVLVTVLLAGFIASISYLVPMFQAAANMPQLLLAPSLVGFSADYAAPDTSKFGVKLLISQAMFASTGQSFQNPTSVATDQSNLYIASHNQIYRYNIASGSVSLLYEAADSDYQSVTLSGNGMMYIGNQADSSVVQINMLQNFAVVGKYQMQMNQAQTQGYRTWGLGGPQGLAFDSKRNVVWAQAQYKIIGLNVTGMVPAKTISETVYLPKEMVHPGLAIYPLNNRNYFPNPSSSVVSYDLYNQVTDLYYHAATDMLYVLLGKINAVSIVSLSSGVQVALYPLPGMATQWSGFSLSHDGYTAFMSMTNTPGVWAFAFRAESGFTAAANAQFNYQLSQTWLPLLSTRLAAKPM